MDGDRENEDSTQWAPGQLFIDAENLTGLLLKLGSD